MFKADSGFFESIRKEVTDFLFNLVSIPSISNEETKACEYCYSVFEKIPGLKLEKIFMDNSLMEHPLWSPGPYEHKGYDGQFCIVATWEGTGEQDPIFFNAHIDTVAPCDPSLWNVRLEGDTLFGLGAKDDKAHVGVIYAMLRYLSAYNIRFPFDIITHVVVEEEIGGNGSLAVTQAAARKNIKAQAAVVLDSSDSVVNHACRGALWIKLSCYGVSRHPGSFQINGKPKSAYTLLKKAIAIVERLNIEHRDECLKNPVKYFEGRIPPFNLGMIHAGNWPATVPTEATAQMLFGVLPGHPHAEMRKHIVDSINADPELNGNCKVEFVFDVRAGVTDRENPMVKQIQSCVREKGLNGEITVMNAACDISYYNVDLGLPTVVIGVGKHQHAHSKDEQVSLTEVLNLAEAMLNWLGIRA
jgi:acetylornithine deacetylase